jgi:ABC-2 type transport system permease protein
MKNLPAALWVETLKLRRSKVSLFTTLGLCTAPLIDGLFMIILKDPEAAKSMGLISAKAQLMVGTAEWITFFSVLAQAIAVGGTIVFAILTAWVFGREFTDHTAKDFLATPTSREAVVSAKFIVTVLWALGIVLLVFIIGLVVGNLVTIPGWSITLAITAFGDVIGSGLLTIMMLSFVAFAASYGRGELPAIGFAVLIVAMSQIAIIMGWGDWFPWSVAGLFSGAAGPREALLGAHSYIIVIISSLVGLAATFHWWRTADQTR